MDEDNISKIMFSYQLLVSCMAAFLQINTYDQRGFGSGKANLAEKVSKKSMSVINKCLFPVAGYGTRFACD